jgi:hypothetical protein
MNAQATNPQPDDDDMPSEIDFSGAVRGKFYKPNLQLKVPLYLDAPIHEVGPKVKTDLMVV